MEAATRCQPPVEEDPCRMRCLVVAELVGQAPPELLDTLPPQHVERIRRKEIGDYLLNLLGHLHGRAAMVEAVDAMAKLMGLDRITAYSDLYKCNSARDAKEFAAELAEYAAACWELDKCVVLYQELADQLAALHRKLADELAAHDKCAALYREIQGRVCKK